MMLLGQRQGEPGDLLVRVEEVEADEEGEEVKGNQR